MQYIHDLVMYIVIPLQFSPQKPEGKQIMWCGYWPISRQHSDVMPYSSHSQDVIDKPEEYTCSICCAYDGEFWGMTPLLPFNEVSRFLGHLLIAHVRELEPSLQSREGERNVYICTSVHYPIVRFLDIARQSVLYTLYWEILATILIWQFGSRYQSRPDTCAAPSPSSVHVQDDKATAS